MNDQNLTANNTRDQLEQMQSAWPGGWYVYEDGKVDGPLTAQEAFSRPSEAASGKPRMVSRKGFSQWYALRDLSEIFRLTEAMGRRLENAPATPSVVTASGLSGSAMHKTPPPPFRVQAGHVGPKGARPEPRSSISESSVTKVAIEAPEAKAADTKSTTLRPSAVVGAAASGPETLSGTAGMPKIPIAEPVTSRPPQSINPGVREVSANDKIILKRAKEAVLSEYFLQRTRLRLGDLRSSWLIGLVGLPLTLGVYWLVWFNRLAHEIKAHAGDKGCPVVPPSLFAIVPIVHFYMVFRLAKAMQAIEAQNRYAGISAPAAAVFALFPPLALIYLQEAANRHWLLHAKHALAAKPKAS